MKTFIKLVAIFGVFVATVAVIILLSLIDEKLPGSAFGALIVTYAAFKIWEQK